MSTIHKDLQQETRRNFFEENAAIQEKTETIILWRGFCQRSRRVRFIAPKLIDRNQMVRQVAPYIL